jgi:chromosome segregation ATPase
MSSKNEYIATMKAQLDEWHAEIVALEAKSHEIKEEAKANYEEQLTALRVKRHEGEKKLEELRLASETTWEQVKGEAEHVRLAFMDAVRTFRSHFKS